MTRIHSHRRGKSQSVRPTFKTAPTWTTYNPDELVTLIVKMAKQGLSQSQIGLRLRDEYAVPSISAAIGKKMAAVLRENKLSPSIPEDIDHLLKRVLSLQNHLKANRGDRKNVRSMELLEAKIHRLSKYYKSKGILPKGWKYTAVVAQLA